MMKRKLSLAQEIVGPVSLLTIGALYGISAVITKHLSGPLDAYQVIEYRFGIAFIGALLLLFLLRQKLSLQHLNRNALLAFAITFPASAILFTLSVFHASVALAVFSFYAANLVAQFVIGRLYFGEMVDLPKKVAFVLAILALLAFTNPFSDFSLTLGLLFGVLSGIIQGVASGFQKLLSGSANRTSLLVIQAFAGMAMAMVILLATGSSLTPPLSGSDWLITIGFGASMLAIMYLFLVGYKYTNLNVGSILVSSELVFAPLFAFLLLSEGLTANVLVGGVLTALAAVIVSLPAKRPAKA